MQAKSAGNAIITAVLSILLMIGALSISLVEFVPQETPTPTSIVPPSPIPVTATFTIQPSATPLLLESPSPTITSTATITATAPHTCPIPPGWAQVTIQLGDTLDNIALRYRINKEQLKSSNCLLGETLVPGTVLYVPPVPTNTVTVCSPGAIGWIKAYTVKSGDTIYSIAVNHGVTANILKTVNCKNSDLIYPGEILWVPNVPTRTPAPTLPPEMTATAIPTEPLTETALPYTVTPIPTLTPEPPTVTPLPTNTPAPTLTASPTAFP